MLFDLPSDVSSNLCRTNMNNNIVLGCFHVKISRYIESKESLINSYYSYILRILIHFIFPLELQFFEMVYCERAYPKMYARKRIERIATRKKKQESNLISCAVSLLCAVCTFFYCNILGKMVICALHQLTSVFIHYHIYCSI